MHGRRRRREPRVGCSLSVALRWPRGVMTVPPTGHTLEPGKLADFARFAPLCRERLRSRVDNIRGRFLWFWRGHRNWLRRKSLRVRIGRRKLRFWVGHAMYCAASAVKRAPVPRPRRHDRHPVKRCPILVRAIQLRLPVTRFQSAGFPLIGHHQAWRRRRTPARGCARPCSTSTPRMPHRSKAVGLRTMGQRESRALNAGAPTCVNRGPAAH